MFGKTVTIDPVTRDRYGRTVVHVYIGGQCLPHEIVAAGYGWHYVEYSNDYTLAHLENKVRASWLGLWKDPHPLAPWNWRKQQRAEKRQYQAIQSSVAGGAGIVYRGNVKSHKFHHPGVGTITLRIVWLSLVQGLGPYLGIRTMWEL